MFVPVPHLSFLLVRTLPYSSAPNCNSHRQSLPDCFRQLFSGIDRSIDSIATCFPSENPPVARGVLLTTHPTPNPCREPTAIRYSSSSTFHNFFTLTLLPGSSALLQTPECSEYHPSEQSPMASALSLTRLQLSGTNSLLLSTFLPLSAILNLP